MSEVRLRKIVKRYDEVEAVRGIDLDIVVTLHHLAQIDFRHESQPFVAPAVRPAM